MKVTIALTTIWQRATNRGSFASQVGMTMLTNIVIAALGIVTGLLSARLLGPQGRGELAAIQLWPMFIVALGMLGMPEAVVYFASRSPERAGRYLTTSVVLIIGASLFSLGIGWWLMPWLLQAQSDDIVQAARVFLLVMLIVYGLAGMPHQVLRAVGARRAWNAFRILPSAGWLVGLLAAFAWFSSANSILLSRFYLLAHLALLLPVIPIVLRYVAPPFRVTRQFARPLASYGIPSMLNVLPQMLNLRLDQLLIATFLSPKSLGLYIVAVAWSGAATPILNAVGPVLFPRVSKIADPIEQFKLLGRVIRLTALSVLALVAILFLLTPVFVPLLFGAAFREAVLPALILVVASGFSSLNSMLGDGLRGLGRPRDVLAAETLGLVVTVVSLSALLPTWQIIGAAVASLLSYALVTTSLLWGILRLRHKHLFPG